MESRVPLLLLLLLNCMLGVDAYKNGKVESACWNMVPQHGGGTQGAASPFTVSTQQTSYSSGQEVTVLLKATSNAFEGFLLLAREVGSTSAVGSFVSAPAGTQTLTCGGSANSALSHNSDAKQTSLQVKWKPASDKDVQFFATFVQSYSTYWVSISSPKVQFGSGSNSTGESFAGSSTGRPSALATVPLGISAGGCGESKVCFRDPPNCDPAQEPASCYFLSAMVVPPTSIQYQLSGPSDGYISFGFSDDKDMGNDDIYICVLDSSGQVQLQYAFSTGTVTPQILSLGSVSDIKTSVQDKVITCSFTSNNSISTQRSSSSSSSSSSSQSYYLLYAYGPSSNGQILKHTDTLVSGEKVDITKPAQVQRAQRPNIIKAHGALMLIAWMCTGSLGMMVARFNKKLAKGHTVCGKDLWFVVHVWAMCLTVAATIVAFTLAFSSARTWSGGVHPVLGCLMMILSFLQPLGALIRCGPQHPKRFLFNWSHALNALGIKALSVAAIFTGLGLIDSSGNQWLMKVMGGYVGWEAVYFLLSDLNLRWNQKSEETHLLKVVMDGPLFPGLFLLGNLAFLVALLVGIGMS